MANMYGLLVCVFGLFLIEYIFNYASVVMCVFMLLFNLLTAIAGSISVIDVEIATSPKILRDRNRDFVYPNFDFQFDFHQNTCLYKHYTLAMSN